jgi:hypothetical protein
MVEVDIPKRVIRRIQRRCPAFRRTSSILITLFRVKVSRGDGLSKGYCQQLAKVVHLPADDPGVFAGESSLAFN